jgi:ceramide glucosyltransferase
VFDLAATLFALAVFSCTGYAVFVTLGLAGWLRSIRAGVSASTGASSDPLPGVSIMKPCAGADDDLEGCLESFCALRYPAMQLVFGVCDERDAALPIIRRVIARHPTLDVAIVVAGEGLHPSPKVNNLEAMAPHARHDLFWLSDSNTRVHPDTLASMVAQLMAPDVGAVVSPVVGDEEITFGSAIENLHLNAFAATAADVGLLVTGLPAVAGKSVLLRRASLEALGAWDELGRYAGEDIILFKRIRDMGSKLVLGRHAVRNVSREATLQRVVARHTRWAQIRWRTVRGSTLLEPLLSPWLIALLALIANPHRATWILCGVAFVVQGIGDLLSVRVQRGRFVAIRYLPAVWLRHLVTNWVWLRGMVTSRFEWRGRAFWMGPQSTILREPASATARWVRATRV